LFNSGTAGPGFQNTGLIDTSRPLNTGTGDAGVRDDFMDDAGIGNSGAMAAGIITSGSESCGVFNSSNMVAGFRTLEGVPRPRVASIAMSV
jgi:hypothetical protein